MLKQSIALSVLFFSLSANAALVSRLGGLAYYDTEADLTWVADANLAQTSGYDADGRMNWANANTWAAGLSVGGVGGWRLANTSPVNGTAFNYTWADDGGTDWGYNISAPGTTYAGSQGSELANMFYNVLGNTGYYDTSGMATGCVGSCLTNTGPFSNVQSDSYWSVTEYAPKTTHAWNFNFRVGAQGHAHKLSTLSAWAVQSGDVSAVPVPAAAWLFGSALLGLAGIKRRK